MKKAIVLGATGGTGEAVVSELLRRNIEVIAFGRSKNKLQNLISKYNNTKLSYALGDIFNYQSIENAAVDLSLIHI